MIDLFEIEFIEEIGKEDVYDISIEENDDVFFQNEHNYIANEIVVHNSHAAGIVVSNVPLDSIAPLRKASKGLLATQFPYEDLEALGLIKFDILAISTLSVIKRTVEMVKQNWGIEIDYKNLLLNDDETFKLYRSGNLGGVFQCENYGMQNTMKDIGVDRFEDIIAGISLYRPGPMDSIPNYCARKRGEERIDYFHPSIEKIVKPFLEETYGIICYQETIMQIVNALAGFSISDGYVMIKAIGKKKEELMNMFESQFVKGCVKNGVPEDVAKEYWTRFIVPFSSYGFNKGHAAAYAYTSYMTAYLKANYPDEFMCSLFNVTINSSVADKYEKALFFEKEFTKKMNIKILPRSINDSKIEYKIEKRKDKNSGVTKTEIRPSILCKGISSEAAKNIVENQPFEDLTDFIRKTDSSMVDSRSFEALIDGGYFGNKAKNNKDKMKSDFLMIREDLKKVSKKGVEVFDMFS